MASAAEAELVRKAMHDAGLDDDRVSAFDEANLMKLYVEGYTTSIALKNAREQDLISCGIPLGLIGALFQGEHFNSPGSIVHVNTSSISIYARIMAD